MEEYFNKNGVKVYSGDINEDSIDEDYFHAVLCDPPYELGFLSKKWDQSGIAFSSETWRKIYDYLYSGGFLMSFSASRGWHRLACAVEDAGFVIHPSIFCWVFGGGFPKATRIDTQIDKDKGEERKVIGEKKSGGATALTGNNRDDGPSKDKWREEGGYNKGLAPVTEPATELAKTWEGHRYGKQCLKPAVEPIIVSQKPYENRPVDDITETGAGSLNIEGCRIEYEDQEPNLRYKNDNWVDCSHKNYDEVFDGAFLGKERSNPNPQGRWPSNFVIDEETAENLDKQSGITKNTRHMSYKRSGGGFIDNIPNKEEDRWFETEYKGASKYFYKVKEQIDEADPVKYCPKAPTKERNAGGCKNNHPTVKPIDLNKYLAKLLLPPSDYSPRRILVPFSGSGSEIIGAMLAGWDEIVGIEMDREYCELAKKRINHYLPKRNIENL